MQPKREIQSWFRVAVVIWASVWMLAAPLFHVHPEADHQHGDAGHIHGGIVHMVFSPDLDGEYDRHHAPDGFGHTTPSHDDFSVHPAHAAELDELAFIFLIDSTEQKLPKPIGPLQLLVESIASIVPAPTFSIVLSTESPPRHTFFTCDIPSRAPPSLSV
jgi:hypothetical protein